MSFYAPTSSQKGQGSVSRFIDDEFGTIRIKRLRTQYLRLKVEPNGQITATIPRYTSLTMLKLFINKNRASLRKSLAKLPVQNHYSAAEIKQFRADAKKYLPKRLKYLADKHGFEFNKLSFRNQKTRWGSCSADKNISLNIALVTLPTELMDYVLLHELTHTIHMNHSVAFWTELERVCPNAKKYRRELRKYSPHLE